MKSQEIKLVDGGKKSSTFKDRLVSKIMKSYLGFVDRMITKTVKNKVGETNIANYKELYALEKNWTSIRKELDQLLNQLDTVVYYEDVDKRYSRETGDEKTKKKDSWKIEQFYLYGHRIERGFKRSPLTGKLLEKIPGIQTALFSILQPKAHIKPHHGEYAGLLRCHLGLKVDSPEACKIRVNDEFFHWKEGKIFIFDHTNEHEAWNNSESIRVILIFDFVRKLPFPLSLLNKIGLKMLGKSSHIKNAKKIFENGPNQVLEPV
ncbi:aspartyl/asparaginyl beta-hydroxylase domain-containing protein [Flavivirga eckloniae]|uniref:Aspartyl beta-hydroxylase n=1 Tax=Flavivirga eckloniae TaxID=1803846 RepID=A0A2K9PQB2_9FLAO|nr:aspartyl/asparaginyl beta-hydroxylase domain-containing protein [Flavivirga eckloniae]AUP79263.1 aspartyl beta-hydroxylase [Flavivirga eckloniae]